MLLPFTEKGECQIVPRVKWNGTTKSTLFAFLYHTVVKKSLFSVFLIQTYCLDLQKVILD